MPHPLMPKATAVWLVDNTSLGFDQIADFCGLHALEVQGIADGEVAVGIVGRDPIANGELTRDELDRCQADRASRLVMLEPEIEMQQRRPGPKYTPLSKRQNRPDAIAWLIKFHPELTDAQVCQLVGTTKPTVVSVRDRSHWNTPNLKPQDPVSLGMCSQTELDSAVQAAAKRLQRKEDRERRAATKVAKEKQAALEAAQEARAASAVPNADAEPASTESASETKHEDVPDTALGAALARAGVAPPDSGSGNESSGSDT